MRKHLHIWKKLKENLRECRICHEKQARVEGYTVSSLFGMGLQPMTYWANKKMVEKWKSNIFGEPLKQEEKQKYIEELT